MYISLSLCIYIYREMYNVVCNVALFSRNRNANGQ